MGVENIEMRTDDCLGNQIWNPNIATLSYRIVNRSNNCGAGMSGTVPPYTPPQWPSLRSLKRAVRESVLSGCL